MTRPYHYIDTAADLDELAAILRDEPWLCLDTEFVREDTYYPRLCLIQVAVPERVAVIDPLALDNLDPLLEVLYQTDSTKVFHAARQDLELFYHLRGELPQPVFDTQIAAALLGYSDQVGYGALVEAMLGVSLGKTQTRTDWSRRPLDAEQLQYAADDVHYLRAIYLKQLEDLQRHGRLDWLREDFAALTDPHTYTNVPEQAWRRLKEARRLRGVQLAVLQALAAWRERRAMELDRPRRWILRDDALLELARAMPRNRAGLERIRGLNRQLAETVGDQLLQTIEQARNRPSSEWPQLPAPIRLDPQQDALVDTLMAGLRICAVEAGISPTMLATRKDLEALVLQADAAVLHGWRRALAGEHLEQILAGLLAVHVQDGIPRLVTTPARSSRADPELA